MKKPRLMIKGLKAIADHPSRADMILALLEAAVVQDTMDCGTAWRRIKQLRCAR